MAIRNLTELLEDIRAALPDATTDVALALIENVTDTMNDHGEDWHARYDENDRAWRERYAARFNDSGNPSKKQDDDDPDKPRSFESLFKNS